MTYQHVQLPEGGQKIQYRDGVPHDVPDNPILGFVEGDGIGVDITPPCLKVWDAAGTVHLLPGDCKATQVRP